MIFALPLRYPFSVFLPLGRRRFCLRPIFYADKPRVASGAILWRSEGKFTLGILAALRGVIGLKSRLRKSSAFAMPVWVAMPKPIAAYFDGAATILTKAFPACFIAFDSLVFYWLNYEKKAKFLPS